MSAEESREFYEDEKLICRDCNNEFVHKGSEQRWMREKFGADYKPPTRCLNCRKSRRHSS